MNPDFRSTQREYDAFFYREKRKGKTPISKELYDLERINRGKFRSDGVYVGIEWNQRLGLPKYLKCFFDPKTGKLDLEGIKNLTDSLQKTVDTNPMTRIKRFHIRKRIRDIQTYLEKEVEQSGKLKVKNRFQQENFHALEWKVWKT
ncbi:hypothetical protein [Leptospira bouyouniensis]|uniref:hypothetical protein n=1 Tax=Leptospira bouyouniensis TaxID=2484911 RepID=UPI0010912535|nr:hypothetical protein [Leptospira bouyouniensis]TGM88258.1 hypothetical protein EHQ99_00135 [Leptospira bouyouniensis]